MAAKRFRTLRCWLMATPRPDSVRLLAANAEPRLLDHHPTDSWADFAKSIDALEPETIEALAADGKVLRATPWDEFSEEEDPEEEQEEQDAPDAIWSSPTDGDDQETRRFRIFADQLSRAYKHATETAFQRLVDICDLSNSRLQNVERCLVSTEKVLRATYQDAVDTAIESAAEQSQKATQGVDPLSELIGAFVAGANQRAATPPTTPPNGKAKEPQA